MVTSFSRSTEAVADTAPAIIEPLRLPPVPVGIIDAATCLVADRVRVEGNLELDDGLTTDGTFRLPNAHVGGYLRLSGARLSGQYGAFERGIALLADGIEVAGDLEGRDQGRGALRCAGQVRLVGARVHGSASLSGITLAAPDGYALLADRLQVAGEFYLRRIRCLGTIRMHNAEIGATLDCTGARLERPRLRPDATVRPSLDLRAAMIGKDANWGILRMASIVVAGVIACGSTLRWMTAGLPEAIAASKAAEKSAVFSTRAPKAP